MKKQIIFLFLIVALTMQTSCINEQSADTQGDIPIHSAGPDNHDSRFAFATDGENPELEGEVSKLSDKLVDWAQSKEIPGGEMMIVQKGEIVLHQASGWSDVEEPRELELNQIFGLDGLVGLYLEAGMLMAVENGLIDLCAPLANYLDEFDNELSRGIIVEQLLGHTTGITDTKYRKLPGEYENIYEAVAEVARSGPGVTPGTLSKGSGINYDIMLVLLETVSGLSLHDYMLENLLTPLGLESTSFDLSKTPSLVPNIVSRYSIAFGGLYHKAWDRDSSIGKMQAWPSRSAFSSISDFAIFLSIWSSNGEVRGVNLTSEHNLKNWRELLYAEANSDKPEECRYAKLQQDASYEHTNLNRWMPSEFGPTVTVFSEYDIQALYFTQVPFNDTNAEFWKGIGTIKQKLDSAK